MIQWEVIALTSLKSPAMSICHWEEWIFHYVFIIDFYLNYIIANPLKLLRFDLWPTVLSACVNVTGVM